MKTFVTFGQDHVHEIGGITFDKDCVAVVEGNREDVFSFFCSKFCMEYPEEYWEETSIKYYKRGYIEVPTATP